MSWDWQNTTEAASEVFNITLNRRNLIDQCLRSIQAGPTKEIAARNFLQSIFPGHLFSAIAEAAYVHVTDRLQSKARTEHHSKKRLLGSQRTQFLDGQTKLSLSISQCFKFGVPAAPTDSACPAESPTAAARDAHAVDGAVIPNLAPPVVAHAAAAEPVAYVPTRLMADASASTQDRHWLRIIQEAEGLVNFAAQFGVHLSMMVASQLTPMGVWRESPGRAFFASLSQVASLFMS